MTQESNAANRFDELDPAVKEMLRRLEDKEVETLKYMATIPKEEFQGFIKLFRDARAVTRFGKWLAVAMVAIFMGTAGLWDSVVKVLAYFKGGSPS